MRGSSARVHCAYTSRCRCGGGFWVGCDRYKCVWYVSDVREMSPKVWRRALAYRRARWGCWEEYPGTSCAGAGITRVRRSGCAGSDKRVERDRGRGTE